MREKSMGTERWRALIPAAGDGSSCARSATREGMESTGRCTEGIRPTLPCSSWDGWHEQGQLCPTPRAEQQHEPPAAVSVSHQALWSLFPTAITQQGRSTWTDTRKTVQTVSSGYDTARWIVFIPGLPTQANAPVSCIIAAQLRRATSIPRWSTPDTAAAPDGFACTVERLSVKRKQGDDPGIPLWLRGQGSVG